MTAGPSLGRYPAISGLTGDGPKQMYVVPHKRYNYWTPKPLSQRRLEAVEKRKRTHTGPLGERTSPFASFWLCNLQARPDLLLPTVGSTQWGFR